MGVNGGVSLLRGVCVWGGGEGGWGWVLLLQDKFVLSRYLGYNNRGDRQVAKRSSDPRVAYPEVKVQVRDLVHCGYCCLLYPTGCGYPGKIRFIEPQGEMGTGDVCRVPPAAV